MNIEDRIDDGMSEEEMNYAELFRRSASMEEAAKYFEPKADTPEKAVRRLKEGNARFFSGKTNRG